MDTNLYNLLISTGLSEEKAKAEASKYVSKETIKIPAKRSLLSYVSDITTKGSNKERLQLSVSILKVLGVEADADMVANLQEFNAEPIELLRRFSYVLESKWIPQKNTTKNDNLQLIANELQGVNNSTPVEVGDDDPLLMAVQNELANNEVVVPDLEEVSVVDIIDEVEEDDDQFGNELDNEQDAPIVTVLGQPVAPTFPPM